MTDRHESNTPLTGGNGQLLDPLCVFYEAQGMPVPTCRRIEGKQLPQPYRELLDHDRDMTSTLENHHGTRIGLRLLQLKHNHQTLLRQVALITADDQRIVEIGAIRIALHRFGPNAQELISAGLVPLGTVLRQLDVSYASRPEAFLCLEADANLTHILDLDRPCTLYGRRNVLIDPQSRTLADVLEILPPMEVANG